MGPLSRAVWAYQHILAGRAGSTLFEVIVGVGILTAMGGFVGGGLYQVLASNRTWADDVLATKDMRNAQSWFVSDAMNAQSVSLVDGAPATTTVSLSWADSGGSLHTSTYSRIGTNLVRNFDGAQTNVARRVVSSTFSRSGKTVSFVINVTGAEGQYESSTVNTFLRLLD
jgi:hypothetical protein